MESPCRTTNTTRSVPQPHVWGNYKMLRDLIELLFLPVNFLLFCVCVLLKLSLVGCVQWLNTVPSSSTLSPCDACFSTPSNKDSHHTGHEGPVEKQWTDESIMSECCQWFLLPDPVSSTNIPPMRSSRLMDPLHAAWILIQYDAIANQLMGSDEP